MEKVRENRLRRVAERRGLSLHKTRRRDPRAADFNTWTVLDSTGKAVAWNLAGLDMVDAALTVLDAVNAEVTDAAAQRVAAFLDAHGKGADELARRSVYRGTTYSVASLRAADLRAVLAELERLARLRAGGS